MIAYVGEVLAELLTHLVRFMTTEPVCYLFYIAFVIFGFWLFRYIRSMLC